MRIRLSSIALFGFLVALPFPALAITRTWTGLASGDWSNAANWSPTAPPAAGDVLVFPSAAGNPVMNNDLPAGTSIGGMTVSGTFTLNGNLLTMTGDVVASGEGTFTCNAPLKAGASLLIDAQETLWIATIDINGQTVSAHQVRFKSINGTGTLISTAMFGFVTIWADGNFSGTIKGGASGGAVDVYGCSLPNATLQVEHLRGAGTETVGEVTISSSAAVGDVSAGPAGVIHTKSFTMNGSSLYAVLDSGSTSLIQATGTVTLNAPALTLGLTFAPSVGQQFKIIDNDGTDPVIGHFTGLPEGATFTSGSFTFSVSYRGGDGNDVVLTVVNPSNKTWTGAASGNWSNAANWAPPSAPAPGEPLVFPLSASHKTMVNDLAAGFALGTITFADAYTLTGNALNVAGNMTASGEQGRLACNVDVTFQASAAVDGVFFGGAANVNGQTIGGRMTFNGPLNGAGTLVATGRVPNNISVNGGGSFAGTILSSAAAEGGLVLGSLLPNATVSLEQLAVVQDSTIGDVTLKPSAFPGLQVFAGYVLHTKSISLSGHDLEVSLAPLSHLQVTGTVSLNCALSAVLNGGVPVPGQAITLIDNDGTDQVIGTFTGLPEGTLLTISPYQFRISYKGGDGNDVVLTPLTMPSVTISQSNASTQFGQALTLTATVASPFGSPTGSVTFLADGVAIGTAEVQGGAAAITISALRVGPHSVTAMFHGTGGFSDSASSPVTHTVSRGMTACAIVADRPSVHYGEAAQFSVTVTVQGSPGILPTGVVTILTDGVATGTAVVAGGTAVFQTTALHAGTKAMSATYAGDANFEGSAAAAVQQAIGKASTAVDARPVSPISVGAAPSIFVLVAAAGNPALLATGSVSVYESDALLGEQSLSGGIARLTLAPLSAGTHQLTVTYGGDGDFEAGSVTVPLTVVPLGISISGAHVLEGDGGQTTVTVPVTLSAAASAAVRVSFATVAGSATEGVDYEKASGVIEFAPGEQTKSIELHIVGDAISEPDETFTVVLSDPVNATIATASAVVVIENDDSPPPPIRHRPARH